MVGFFDKILNPDLSQSGMKDGMADGAAGKPRNYSGMLSEPRVWLQGNASQDTYIDGYNKGHDTGSIMASIPDDTLASVGAAMGGGMADGIVGRVVAEPLDMFGSTLERGASVIHAATEQLLGTIRAQQSANEWDDPNFMEVMELMKQLAEQASSLADSCLMPMAKDVHAHAERARAINVR